MITGAFAFARLPSIGIPIEAVLNVKFGFDQREFSRVLVAAASAPPNVHELSAARRPPLPRRKRKLVRSGGEASGKESANFEVSSQRLSSHDAKFALPLAYPLSDYLKSVIRINRARNVAASGRSKGLPRRVRSRFVIAMKFSTSAPRDCAGLAAQLTALFDGEADDVAARQARAHLLICPSCSRLWLDWSRHRDTLQSEPVPSPPPTLLWRVLIAYRVAAFARPARHPRRLPLIAATALRDIEAPLPPRLSQHILARTTRQPSAHVMLTPMSGPAPAAKSRWKSRSFSFRGAPLWAAPALALWILMLGRANLTATLPDATPDATGFVAPNAPDVAALAKADSPAEKSAVATIPVASFSAIRAANSSAPESVEETGAATVARTVEPAVPRARVSARSENAAPFSVASPVVPTIVSSSRARAVPVSSRSDAGLRHTFLLAMNAGQRDIERARTAPLAPPNAVRAARVSLISAPAVQAAPVTPIERQPARSRSVRPIAATPRATRMARRAPENIATARVTLAALAAPISPIRTVSAARLNPAAFSEDSLRPRTVHLSGGGRRLARLMPESGEIPLRVSRPIAGAPTLREISSDNGPKLDELRSAVDDFRASVADAE